MKIYTIETISRECDAIRELRSRTALLSVHEERVDIIHDRFYKTHEIDEYHNEEFEGDCACGEPDNDHTLEDLKHCQYNVDFKDW